MMQPVVVPHPVVVQADASAAVHAMINATKAFFQRIIAGAYCRSKHPTAESKTPFDLRLNHIHVSRSGMKKRAP